MAPSIAIVKNGNIEARAEPLPYMTQRFVCRAGALPLPPSPNPAHNVINRRSIKIRQNYQKAHWDFPFSCLIVAVCSLVNAQQRRNFFLSFISILPQI